MTTITVTHNQEGGRTDPLRPQVFDPADVEVVGFADLQPPAFSVDPLLASIGMFEQAVQLAREARENWERHMTSLFGTPFPGRSCAHCGHHPIRWAFAVKYLPTGQVFPFGEICGDERAELENRDAFDRRIARRAAELARQREELMRKQALFLQEHEDVVRFLDGVRRVDGFPCDRLEFVNSMVRAFIDYGELTERQLAATQKIMDRRAEWANEEAIERGPAPEGRQTIEGVVRKIVYKDDEVYGGSFKMTVELDNGSRVWGTVPGKFYEEMQSEEGAFKVGSRVRFAAAFSPKADDPTFAWFKRPTKAEVL